jgi:hypothetical protein
MSAIKSSDRLALFLLAMLFLLTSIPAIMIHARAWSEADTSRFDFTNTSTSPRELEDQTQNAIKREYAAAWQNMDDALAQNRADLVDKSFVGGERDQLLRQIDQQKKNGITSKLDDRSHKVEFAFYSPEGTAIELHDTVELSQDTMDGGKSIHSDSTTQKYVVIFTLVGDKWKVRTLQQVAGG